LPVPRRVDWRRWLLNLKPSRTWRHSKLRFAGRRRFRSRPTMVSPKPSAASVRKLFHDPKLSVDGSTACATCHIRDKGFADGRERGTGVSGQRLGRHTPTLVEPRVGASGVLGRARQKSRAAGIWPN